MNSRLFAMGLALLSAGLVACGGGGGGGNLTPTGPTPTPQPTNTPTPRPTDNPYGCVGQPPFTSAAARRSSIAHPVAAGDSFSYSGTLARVYTQSAPCPQPTATSSASISVSVSNSSASSPSGATDVKSVETDAYPTTTLTTTTDQIVGTSGTSPNQVYQLFSTASTDGSGNTISTVYSNPQVLDRLPETASDSWGGTTTNNPAASVNETLADGTKIARAVHSDGTYTDTETYVNGSSAAIAIPDLSGAGSYDLAAGLKCGGEVDFSYAAPASGSITLSITTYSYDSNNVCQPASKTRTFPAWFTVPSSGSYINDNFIDNGVQPFDSHCNVPAAIGTSGQQLVETYTVLDPVLGYTETRTTTSYIVSGFGAACVKIADNLNSYYDYSSDTTKIDYQSQNGQPNSVNSIVEYLSMTSPTTAYPALRTATAGTAVSPASVAARVASIDYQRSIEVAKRAAALHSLLLHLSAKGAVR